MFKAYICLVTNLIRFVLYNKWNAHKLIYKGMKRHEHI